MPYLDQTADKKQCDISFSDLVNNSIYYGEFRGMIKDACPHVVNAATNVIEAKAENFFKNCVKE